MRAREKATWPGGTSITPPPTVGEGGVHETPKPCRLALFTGSNRGVGLRIVMLAWSASLKFERTRM